MGEKEGKTCQDQAAGASEDRWIPELKNLAHHLLLGLSGDSYGALTTLCQALLLTLVLGLTRRRWAGASEPGHPGLALHLKRYWAQVQLEQRCEQIICTCQQVIVFILISMISGVLQY